MIKWIQTSSLSIKNSLWSLQARGEKLFREAGAVRGAHREREFFIDNLLVQIHYIIVMIRWTGLAPWESEFPFPGSLTSTFLSGAGRRSVSGSRSHPSPLSSEFGTHNTVTARFWPWLEPFPGKSLQTLISYPLKVFKLL